VFLPALYPGTHEHADEKVKMGRDTDWQAGHGEILRGRGSRLFLVGEDSMPLLEWRALALEETPAEAPAAAPPAAPEAPAP
jgi:protein involved in temperature-dependent protein secretion